MSRQGSVGLLLGSSMRRLKQGVAARVRRHGLTPRQFGALVALFESGGSSLHALAERMGIDDPTASRVVATLERRRLVLAGSDPADRRVVRLTPAREAAPLRAPLLAVAREMRAALLRGFRPAERRALREGLARVLENAERFACERAAASHAGPRARRAAR